MKILLLLVPLMFLTTGCENPPPMTEAEASVMKACLEKGWKPRFYAYGDRRDITCKRK